MSKPVEDIEQEVARLTPDQLAQFRAWFEEFDADAWDRQIEQDASAGKLDSLAQGALSEHKGIVNSEQDRLGAPVSSL
jgi:hypothetical protein